MAIATTSSSKLSDHRKGHVAIGNTHTLNRVLKLHTESVLEGKKLKGDAKKNITTTVKMNTAAF